MNKYQANPDEFDRIKNLVAAGLKADELARIFRYRDAFFFGQALGLETRRRNESMMVAAIYRTLTGPAAPTRPVPPEPVKPIEPVVNDTAPECVNCGDMYDAVGKVWEKAYTHKLTFSLDMKNAPTDLVSESDIEELFGQWAAVCGVQFKKLRRGRGDIHFQFSDLDGDALGAAYQSETSRMEDGGMLAGDIFIDYTRQWEKWILNLTILHEIGHAIGMPHSPEVADVMYFRPGAAGKRRLSANDIKLVLNKYPKLKTGVTLK